MTTVGARLSRPLWLVAGCLAVAIGSVGIVVPVLPTTVFFIIAAWCFSKSSPRLEAWVLGLRGVGPLVRDHRNGLGMPRRAKVIATATMWAAITFAVVVATSSIWLRVLAIVLGLIGAAYIWFRVPTREVVLAERELAQH